VLTRDCHWTSSWGSWIQRMPSNVVVSSLVLRPSKCFLLLRVFCMFSDTIFSVSFGHGWLMPTVCIRIPVVSLTLQVTFTCILTWLMFCESVTVWRFQWLRTFSWVLTWNKEARFWYYYVSGRLAYIITQARVHAHTHTHTYMHFVNGGHLSLEVSVNCPWQYNG
jgi:hypothetical protein